MKKLILTIVLSFGLIGVIITSCICKDVQDYWMPKSMSSDIVDLQSSMTTYEPNDTVYTDSMYIKVNFEHIYFSEIQNDFYNFGNSAFAFQKCPLNGHEGLKYAVESFKITSNKDFDSIPAGENLSHILYMGQDVMSDYYVETFDVIQQAFQHHHIEDYLIFNIKQKPINTESRYFTLTWTFKNGQISSAQTQNVVW